MSSLITLFSSSSFSIRSTKAFSTSRTTLWACALDELSPVTARGFSASVIGAHPERLHARIFAAKPSDKDRHVFVPHDDLLGHVVDEVAETVDAQNIVVVLPFRSLSKRGHVHDLR